MISPNVMHIKVFPQSGWKAAFLHTTRIQRSHRNRFWHFRDTSSSVSVFLGDDSHGETLGLCTDPCLSLTCPDLNSHPMQKFKQWLMFKMLSRCHKGLPVLQPNAYGYFSCQTSCWITFFFSCYVYQCTFVFMRKEATKSINPPHNKHVWQSITHQLFLLAH